jgi:hypothetical protein
MIGTLSGGKMKDESAAAEKDEKGRVHCSLKMERRGSFRYERVLGEKNLLQQMAKLA